jgi:N-methylhydantoinase A
MLASPVTREASRTILTGTDDPGLPDLMSEVFRELEERARDEMSREGADVTTLTVERWVDARYRGQSFELRTPADGWVQHFHSAHEERYGYRRTETPVEAVTLRVVVTAPPVSLEEATLPEAAGAPPTESSSVVFGGATLEASRMWRRDLRPGHAFRGPAIIQEYSATTWVPPEWRTEVDRHGCLHLIPEI